MSEGVEAGVATRMLRSTGPLSGDCLALWVGENSGTMPVGDEAFEGNLPRHADAVVGMLVRYPQRWVPSSVGHGVDSTVHHGGVALVGSSRGSENPGLLGDNRGRRGGFRIRGDTARPATR